MTESIIKAHILQFSEPSSSRLSSALKESREFLEYIESSLRSAENRIVELKNNFDCSASSDLKISSPAQVRKSETLALLINAIEKRARAVEEFRDQHDIAERALERANGAILDRLNGISVLQNECGAQESSS
jgi:hypothetical protein